MYHFNEEKGIIGKCSAVKGRCPFGNPNDENNGHYESLEEAERALEERYEKEDKGLTVKTNSAPFKENIYFVSPTVKEKLFEDAGVSNIPQSGLLVKESIYGKTVSLDGLSDSEAYSIHKNLLDKYYEDVSIEKGLSGSKKVIVSRSNFRDIPEAGLFSEEDEYKVKEQLKDVINNQEIDNKEKDYIIDSIYGKDFMKSSINRMSRKFNEIIESKDSYSENSTGFYAAIKFANEINSSGDNLKIDFTSSNPVGNNDPELVNRWGATVREGYKEQVKREIVNEVHGVSSIKGYNFELSNYIAERTLSQNGIKDNSSALNSFYRGYAKKYNLSKVKPDYNKFPSTGGYQVPAMEMQNAIKETLKDTLEYHESTRGRFLTVHKRSPLGKILETENDNWRGVLIKTPANNSSSISIDFYPKVDKNKNTATIKVQDNGLLPNRELNVSLDTGEGIIAEGRPKHSPGELLPTSHRTGEKRDFKLTKRLPKNYTKDNLEDFIASETMRVKIFGGKPWSRIKFIK